MPDVAKNRPWYIAFEGAEASGKSTQAALLAKRLDAVLTRETGGTAIGSRIRDILHDTANDALCDRAEALLIAADRAQHLAEVVEPALRSRRHVVSDRSVYSTLAYQGYGRGLSLDDLRRFNEWAVSGRWPDLVLLIDVPQPVVSLRMQHRQLDRFERAGDDFHRRVADGFATMAAEDRQRWVVIDGTGSIEEVATLVRRALESRGVPVVLP